MKIATLDIGFVEVPEHIMLNIYAVGCKKDCDNCHNPDLKNFDYKKAYELTDEMFSTKIEKALGLIDGVCWLGGDAIYQEKRLIELSIIVKKQKEIFNCLYTGLKFEDISKDIKEVMDVIVDGEWRGKDVKEKETNQTIWIKKNKKWKNISYADFRNVRNMF